MFSSRILLVAGLLCGTAFGQIAFDATSAPASSQGGATSFTWSHTVGAGLSNGVLIACIGGTNTPASIRVGGTTCSNGTVLSTFTNNSGTNGTIRSYCAYQVAPTAGANTIRACWSSAPADAWAASVSLSGVDQTTPVEAATANAKTSTSISSTVTTLTDLAWGVDYWFEAVDCGGTPAASAGQTTRQGKRDSANGRCTGMSTKASVTPAGSTTLSWGTPNSGGNPVEHIVMAVKPAGGSPPATSTPRMTLLGVGP